MYLTHCCARFSQDELYIQYFIPKIKDIHVYLIYTCIYWILMSLESSIRNCFVDLLRSAEVVLESFSDDIHHHVFQKGPILSASLQGRRSQRMVTISIFPCFCF